MTVTYFIARIGSQILNDGSILNLYGVDDQDGFHRAHSHPQLLVAVLQNSAFEKKSLLWQHSLKCFAIHSPIVNSSKLAG